MCLLRVFTDAKMEEWLAEKPEVIEVYKYHPNPPFGKPACYASLMKSEKYYTEYLNGLNKAIATERIKCGDTNSRYWAGFHFFSEPAKSYFERESDKGYYTRITCLVRKEWITAIGIEGWRGNQFVIITSQAVFPHYPETEARLEDVPKEEVVLAQPQEQSKL